MTVSKYRLVPFALATVLASGCTTTQADRRASEMRQQAHVQNIKADLQRLQSRVDGMVTAQEDIYRQIEGMRRTVEGREGELDRRFNEISDGLAGTAAAREALKRDMIDSVTRNMKAVIKSRPPPVAQYSQRGVEHTVESGQTLSAIASAYGVSTRILVQANNLKNPDALREGQKLFIPE